ncbi:hypothetical protein FIBSPDRAFT_861544 [Athelia psychrophila]|uniref:Uncharacterized protein n=1 Tax=Athelia psychrophila TaxID=1759441 RepID=A0A166J6G4_9AGAM|nr:hypothetical protein FIBSPDRAFT_861544 [Fibularhizoctonia sp. CBS 109695]
MKAAASRIQIIGCSEYFGLGTRADAGVQCSGIPESETTVEPVTVALAQGSYRAYC